MLTLKVGKCIVKKALKRDKAKRKAKGVEPDPALAEVIIPPGSDGK